MYKEFQLATVPLSEVLLDLKNPRIVSAKTIETQDEILEFLFEHEKLIEFIKDIAQKGKNPAAERPYVFRDGKKYIVGEGNTRIAAYKVLTGLLKSPKHWSAAIPKLTGSEKKSLQDIDVSIAPSKESLAPIKARLHFGLGDKAGWSWLSSRQEIASELQRLKSSSEVAKVFNKSNSEIQGFLMDYEIYKEAVKLKWTEAELHVLQQPRLEFNPPIRFLETKGHKEKVGILLDKTNIKVSFADATAKQRFKHLVAKLVVHRTPGIGATASYEAVFEDFKVPTAKKASPKSSGDEKVGGDGHPKSGSPGSSDDPSGEAGHGKGKGSSSGGGIGQKKPGRLFNYKPKVQNTLIEQLMTEAAELDCKKFPGAGTVLLRCIVEAVAKRIIQENKLDPDNKVDDLSTALSLLRKSPKTPLTKEERKIIEEFGNQNLQYLNLVAHANVRPNFARLETVLSIIDMFIKKHV